MAERLDQRREQAAWLYVIIVLVIVFALSELISRYYFSDPQPDDKAGYPLFVMTRWTNPLKSIPIDKLNLAYCAGRVSVMFSSKSLADRMFSCKNKTVIKDNAGLLRVSATHLIVGDIDSLSPRYKAISVSGKDYFTMPKDYPLVNSPRRNHDTIAKSLTRISITGVTAITRATGIIADRHGPNYLIQKVKRQFKDSHYVHISNEVSVIPNHSYGGGLKFATKPEHLAVIKKLNPNIFVELTGNHIRDFGNGPLLNTLKWYRDNNIPYFGGGKNPVEAAKPLILKLKDKSTLAFIGFNTNCILGECSKSRNQPGANPYHSQKAKQIIHNLRVKQGVNYIIASAQFRERDSYYPIPNQIRVARELISFGADMVYGSQAHQIQIAEFHKGRPVFYGLGNFLFDQIHKPGVRQGMFLHLYFYRGRLIQIVPFYTMISNNRRPVPASQAQSYYLQSLVFQDRFLYRP